MRKGFTLIELLAVIVILAVIALIATPIVLNIINETKESALLRSADFYLEGVETSIATSVLKNIQVPDGTYSIMEDGNICIGTLSGSTCTGYILKVEMDGEVPSSGTITIINGQIGDISLNLSDKTITKNNKGELVFGESQLAPGLYDENNNLILSWDEAVELLYIEDSIIMGQGELLSYGPSKLVIGEGVTDIWSDAFLDTFDLISVTIPSNVTNISSSAFSSSTNLATIIVDENNPIYDSRDNSNAIIETATNKLIAGCKNTTIPNTVTTIGDGAFSGHTGLTSITIPSSVITIESYAFIHLNLTEITIPNSVTSIASTAFNWCPSLTTIYYKGTATGAPWGAENATVVTDF